MRDFIAKYLCVLLALALHTSSLVSKPEINFIDTDNLEDTYSLLYVEGEYIFFVDCENPLQLEEVTKEDCNYKNHKSTKLDYKKVFLPSLKSSLGQMNVDEVRQRLDYFQGVMTQMYDDYNVQRDYAQVDSSIGMDGLYEFYTTLEDQKKHLKSTLNLSTIRLNMFEEIKAQIEDQEKHYIEFVSSTTEVAIQKAFEEISSPPNKLIEYPAIVNGIEVLSYYTPENSEDEIALVRHQVDLEGGKIKLKVTNADLYFQNETENLNEEEPQIFVEKEIDYQNVFIPRVIEFLDVVPMAKINSDMDHFKKLRLELAKQLALTDDDNLNAENTDLAKTSLNNQLKVLNKKIEELSRQIRPQELRNKFLSQIKSILESKNDVTSRFFEDTPVADAILYAFKKKDKEEKVNSQNTNFKEIKKNVGRDDFDLNKEIELTEENDEQEVEKTIKIDDKKEKYAQEPIHDHSHGNDKKDDEDGESHCKKY